LPCVECLVANLESLYVEWEAVYVHLAQGNWKVETFDAGTPVHQMVRYKIDSDLSSSTAPPDQRTVSGRTLVLPQQIFSLKSMVGQIPLTKDMQKEYNLTPDEVEALLHHVDEMQYISCPLSGFTNHLLTLVEGSHVKPLARTSPQGEPEALQAAVTASRLPGFTSPIFDICSLQRIGTQSALTPYGNLVAFPSPADHPVDPNAKIPAGFKAVTHGQVMITKFNIIDKFGQAVCAIDPKPVPAIPVWPPPSVYPCISDYFAPGALVNPTKPPDFLPNVVFRDPTPIERDLTVAVPGSMEPDVPLTTSGKESLSRFFQLSPSINQDARINATFVQQDPANSKNFLETRDWVCIPSCFLV
jgi:hypothetical protein